MSVRQLGMLIGLHPETIGEPLIALPAVGLVSVDGGGPCRWHISDSSGPDQGTRPDQTRNCAARVDGALVA